ncbi:MAG: FAD-binding oxidoreductase [Alphaproteobacteria bacterium]|jgi:FAD/FMN-containing dehydrogenase|nr:FAD-binding oxidoreductase [Alphaproteobacteria bacterium]MDP6517842.1 FAD-binding oxidoreductase [Alphaproteobacteria bacterium]
MAGAITEPTLAAPSAPVIDAALGRIRAIVGDRGWTTDPGEIAPHVIDQRDRYHGAAAMLVKPADTAQVAAVVGVCADQGIAIVPQGGNTSVCGGSVPGTGGDEIVLNLSRMNRVRDIDPANYTLCAEAGCILADLQAAAAEADRLFPLSLAAEGSCEIGGNLSTNAGGINVLRYGMARDLVLGLEVVLPDGTVWDGLRALRKDNTGYDLKQLFIGAEGTLGVITAAVLKLFPIPRVVTTALVAVAGLDEALTLLSCARSASGDQVSAFELLPRIALDFVCAHVPGTRDPLAKPHDHYVLIELSSGDPGPALAETMERLLGQAVEDGLVLDGVIAANTGQSRDLWKLRDSCSEAQKHEGGSIKHDVSVAVSRVPEFIRRATALVEAAIPGARPVPFGHVGDGNIHFNVSQPPGADKAEFLDQWDALNRIVHDLVHEMGGSFSAEHGVGQLKRDDLARYRPAIELALMRRIKTALDPRGIMNPGKVV